MIKKYFLLIIIGLLFVSCSQDKEYTALNFPVQINKFDDLFKIENTIRVKTKNVDSIKIFSILKLHEIDANKFLIIDGLGRATYLIDSLGIVTKRISRPGQGPGELNFVRDFTFDDNGNLFLLDPIQNKIAMYDSSFRFIKNFYLSYEHRMTNELRYSKGCFLISSQRNLDKNSTSTNFSFLKYSQNTFIMVYDKNFNLISSFLNPAEEILETEGSLALSKENFSPFCIKNNKIFAMTEEGFNRLLVFDMNYSLVKKYEVENSKFKKIDLNRVKTIKIVNNKLVNTTEELGQLVTSYTSPVSLDVVKDNLIVTMQEPSSNYYPEFNKDNLKKYYYDIYKIVGDQLTPQFSNIEVKKRIIGVSQNKLYFVDDFGMHADEYIVIEKGVILK